LWISGLTMKMHYAIATTIFGLIFMQESFSNPATTTNSPTNRGLNWKVFEQFIVKRRTYEQEAFQAVFNGSHVVDDGSNAVPFERARKGPFLSMFPGSAAPQNPGVFDEDVGQPLILTPFLESGQVQKARELSMVKNLTSSSSSAAKIETYSGFLTVNKTYDSNLFFWFAPAQVHKSPIQWKLWF
jgi:hypothetical protein